VLYYFLQEYCYNKEQKMKYVIIGNGISGMSAAEAVRKKDAGADIVIYTSERYFHYYRPGVIEFLAGRSSLEKITIRNSDFYEKNRIRLVILAKIIKIDPAKRTVVLEGGIEDNYEKLLIAAGASSFLPLVAGSDNEGVFTLRTIDDAKAIMEYAKGKKTAVAIGAGLLGIEAAMSLTALGLQVTLVEVFDRLLPRQLDKDAAAMLQGMLEAKGLRFMLPKQTQSIKREQAGLVISFKDNTAAKGDLVLFSAGIRSNLKIVEGSGIAVDRGIKVNDHMETNIQDIYAAGDAAEHKGIVYGIWPVAKDQGSIAGQNMAGDKAEYKGSVLSTTLKVTGIELGSIGNIEAGPDIEVFTSKGPGVFKRLFVKDGKVEGAILLGDAKEYAAIREAARKKEIIVNPRTLIGD
jgi:nitrite reductase (NADH) large subunit